MGDVEYPGFDKGHGYAANQKLQGRSFSLKSGEALARGCETSLNALLLLYRNKLQPYEYIVLPRETFRQFETPNAKMRK
jgi:hypothetical protein